MSPIEHGDPAPPGSRFGFPEPPAPEPHPLTLERGIRIFEHRNHEVKHDRRVNDHHIYFNDREYERLTLIGEELAERFPQDAKGFVLVGGKETGQFPEARAKAEFAVWELVYLSVRNLYVVHHDGVHEEQAHGQFDFEVIDPMFVNPDRLEPVVESFRLLKPPDGSVYLGRDRRPGFVERREIDALAEAKVDLRVIAQALELRQSHGPATEGEAFEQLTNFILGSDLRQRAA